jgi:hypothetical protein
MSAEAILLPQPRLDPGRALAWARAVITAAGLLRTASLTTVLAAALVATVGTDVARVNADVPPSLPGAYGISGATPAERDLFDEVHKDFVAAGLELPASLSVEFTDRAEDCGGHPAIYIYGADAIVFCRPAEGEWKALRRLIIHELGHVWDDLAMTEAGRRAYMCSFGFDESTEWLEPGLAHDRRPGEMFANTVGGLVRGFMDRDRFDARIGAAGIGSDGCPV